MTWRLKNHTRIHYPADGSKEQLIPNQANKTWGRLTLQKEHVTLALGRLNGSAKLKAAIGGVMFVWIHFLPNGRGNYK